MNCFLCFGSHNLHLQLLFTPSLSAVTKQNEQSTTSYSPEETATSVNPNAELPRSESTSVANIMPSHSTTIEETNLETENILETMTDAMSSNVPNEPPSETPVDVQSSEALNTDSETATSSANIMTTPNTFSIANTNSYNVTNFAIASDNTSPSDATSVLQPGQYAQENPLPLACKPLLANKDDTCTYSYCITMAPNNIVHTAMFGRCGHSDLKKV